MRASRLLVLFLLVAALTLLLRAQATWQWMLGVVLYLVGSAMHVWLLIHA